MREDVVRAPEKLHLFDRGGSVKGYLILPDDIRTVLGMVSPSQR
jgi:hypothetical protein